MKYSRTSHTPLDQGSSLLVRQGTAIKLKRSRNALFMQVDEQSTVLETSCDLSNYNGP